VADVALIVVALVIARYWWSATLMVVATGPHYSKRSSFVVRRYRPNSFARRGDRWIELPSGHATDTCAFALVIIYLVWHVYPHRGLMTAGALLCLRSCCSLDYRASCSEFTIRPMYLAAMHLPAPGSALRLPSLPRTQRGDNTRVLPPLTPANFIAMSLQLRRNMHPRGARSHPLGTLSHIDNVGHL
jgi:hypothetical protein